MNSCHQDPSSVISMTEPNRRPLCVAQLKTAALYPSIKACLAEWSAGAADMTDESMARALRNHDPANHLGPDAWLVYRAIGLGMRLVVGRDRHGDFCRLVEGIQLERPTVNVPGAVAKELIASGLLRQMEEHDSKSHGGWRSSCIRGEGCQVYALAM